MYYLIIDSGIERKILVPKEKKKIRNLYSTTAHNDKAADASKHLGDRVVAPDSNDNAEPETSPRYFHSFSKLNIHGLLENFS